MKKYVFYKDLKKCGLTLRQEFIDWATSFFLEVSFVGVSETYSFFFYYLSRWYTIENVVFKG